jgi:hypothetical protein
MQDYRVETKVSSDGSVTLKRLPFQAGGEVEVIIRSREHREGKGENYPLRGKPIRYTDPFDSGPKVNGTIPASWRLASVSIEEIPNHSRHRDG